MLDDGETTSQHVNVLFSHLKNDFFTGFTRDEIGTCVPVIFCV